MSEWIKTCSGILEDRRFALSLSYPGMLHKEVRHCEEE